MLHVSVVCSAVRLLHCEEVKAIIRLRTDSSWQTLAPDEMETMQANLVIGIIHALFQLSFLTSTDSGHFWAWTHPSEPLLSIRL